MQGKSAPKSTKIRNKLRCSHCWGQRIIPFLIFLVSFFSVFKGLVEQKKRSLWKGSSYVHVWVFLCQCSPEPFLSNSEGSFEGHITSHMPFLLPVQVIFCAMVCFALIKQVWFANTVVLLQRTSLVRLGRDTCFTLPWKTIKLAGMEPLKKPT